MSRQHPLATLPAVLSLPWTPECWRIRIFLHPCSLTRIVLLRRLDVLAMRTPVSRRFISVSQLPPRHNANGQGTSSPPFSVSLNICLHMFPPSFCLFIT